MALIRRAIRHARLSARSMTGRPGTSPPFLVLFINSICNLTCDHCFYWRNLNQRDDLSFEEFARLSAELGNFEQLNLSGGEPFIRKEFAEIVRLFVEGNGVRQVYVPTNGFFPDRTEKAVRKVLESKDLQLFACELSLDGLPEYHDRFRGNPKSFERAMETYDVLAGMQVDDPRLRVHAITTATNQNVGQIVELSEHLHERCPRMDHHNLAIIRGERKDASLLTPGLEAYENVYRRVKHIWRDREQSRFGASVEPMLQWGKLENLKKRTQFVPCTAGRMTGVIYANGDVSVCELHEPIGNLRERSFQEIWHSEEAERLREQIRCKECWCTTEVFLWPSIVYEPMELGRALFASRRKWKAAGRG